MENKRLKNTIEEMVKNQIRGNDPSYVKDAYDELLELGYQKQDAREKIGAVLLSEIYEMTNGEEQFNNKRYQEAIGMMLEDEYMEEDFWGLEEEPWIGMDILLERGNQIFDDLEDTEGLKCWEDAWTLLKENVKNAYKKPEIFEVDEATEFRYGFEDWLPDMASVYRWRNEYEKCIAFCQEVLDIFAWEQVTPNAYRTVIGNVLRESGRIDESDRWFDEWIRNEPENLEAAGEAVYHWMKRSEKKKAEQLLEQTINEKMECDYDNCNLFMRASSFYKEVGETKKAESYQRKYEAFMEKLQKDSVAFWNQEDFLPFVDGRQDLFDVQPRQPVVKNKKIYPNEPCPCGSGKKYKKCCGR